MAHFVLNGEQAQVLASSNGEIELCDSTGRHLGYAAVYLCNDADDVSEEDINVALQRRAEEGEYFTTAEVIAHLEALETE